MRASIYEPLLDKLVMLKKTEIAVDEAFNKSTLRSQWSRYKKKMMNLPAMSQMVDNKTLKITETEKDTIILELVEKDQPYKLVE